MAINRSSTRYCGAEINSSSVASNDEMKHFTRSIVVFSRTEPEAMGVSRVIGKGHSAQELLGAGENTNMMDIAVNNG
jgi:hypothetical protein